MEVDVPPMPYRTRSSTKRSRSPSSPTQYDRPSKRASSGMDTSVPLPFQPALARVRVRTEDWVSQTQGLRLESPSLENSGYNTPVSLEDAAGVRIDETMVDEPMVRFLCGVSPVIPCNGATSQNREDNAMSVSPPRPMPVFSQAPHTPFLGTPSSSYPHTSPAFQNPNQLQIPSIQIQAATPSPVQMFPQHPFPDSTSSSASVSDIFFTAPPEQVSDHSPSLLPPHQQQDCAQTQASSGSRKQRFTMGPRADCELCRMRVKGHYMHFD
ncbi:hypothetical protein L226DRAFT_613984 [Lentinus tigrinus ALCF2SS1-7]|uniref:Uncharacterized protein n=1 Tax=Lentinus tigrinus ALCF2SS1-6 TaxID=1328759 RepID=A0A5C2S7N0_9APHY|nr:hypothetical protein L227DRAFT_612131 [Lentinus tigrinus ALCF2SS1-6]RPD73469.1 hypothetical protein L226DRAFT_613984 [Lentinus tigrinus ALCF2SS1-7]